MLILNVAPRVSNSPEIVCCCAPNAPMKGKKCTLNGLIPRLACILVLRIALSACTCSNAFVDAMHVKISKLQYR